MGPMTIAEIFARDFAKMVELDVAPITVQWGGSGTNSFVALLGPVDETHAWEQGGFIDNISGELSIPKYTADDTVGALTAQFTESSPGIWDIPKAEDRVIAGGVERRVHSVSESPDGSGWTMKLESVDK